MANTWTWRDEFGAEYAPPAEVLALCESGELFDQSWHNDVCPSFTHRDIPHDGVAVDLRLWCDAPDPDQRENGPSWPRFSVCEHISQTTYYAGDDIAEALRVYRETVASWIAHGGVYCDFCRTTGHDVTACPNIDPEQLAIELQKRGQA